MAKSAADPFEQAKALYREKLTEDSTREIRKFLKQFVDNYGTHSPADVAYGWSLLANIKLCDYLNRWNKAGRTELDEAADHITNALNLDPNHSFAYYATGFLHRAKGDHEAAQQAFRQSLDLGGAYRARAQYANEFVYLGQPEEAVQEIEAALANCGSGHPARGMFQWIKGRALFFNAQYEEAVPCFEESIRSWQKLWYNRLYLASAYALTGRRRQAKDQLKQFDEQFPGYASLAQIAQLERTSPNESLFAHVGRRNFRQGLWLAGRT